MVRVVLTFSFVSLLAAAPALAQVPAPAACAPATPGAQTSMVDQLKLLFDASGGRMEVRPEDDALVLTGLVELPIPCQTGTRISADVVEILFDKGLLIASGNVVFADLQGRIAAERVEFNIREGTGTFHQASGIMTIVGANRAEFGNQDPDIYFYGELIEKLSADRYRLTRGGFTTCVQPEPRWEIVSKSVVLNRNDYAMARNMVLRVKGVPMLYLPLLYYPIKDDERATGFLMPSYGTSTLRGSSISNAFFWAINRSQDATVFHDWFTRVGQGMGGEYRYVGNGLSSGNARVYRFSQREAKFDQNGTAQVLPAQISYLVNSTINQDVGRMRAQARVEYFTDIQTGQLYFRDPYQQTQSRRIIDGGIGGNFGPATIGAYYQRSEVFSDARNSTVTGTQPRATASVTPLRLFGLPLYGGVTGEYGTTTSQARTDGIVKLDDGLTRIDAAPSLRAPLSRLTYLSALVTAAYRMTYYSRSLGDDRRLGPAPVTRQFLALQSQLVGPVFSKIWDTPGSTFSARKKHVVEPTFIVDYVTDITNQARIPVVDSIGYAVGGAMRLTYGITNRLLARKPDAGGARGATTEFLTIGVQQTFYSDPESSRYDSTYASYALRPRPVDLSPLAFTVRLSPASGFDTNARVEYDVNGNGLQILTAGTMLSRAGRTASVSFSRQRPTPASPVSSYVSGSTALAFVQNRITTNYGLNWDIDANFIQSQSLAVSYMAQCCGVRADFQTVNFPRSGGFPIPSDRRVNFAVVLAGLGTFSNFFGAFGGQP